MSPDSAGERPQVGQEGIPRGMWSVRKVIELHWRDWGSDSVVYESRSGQVFQFDALASAVMAFFESSPATTRAACLALQQDLGEAGDGIELGPAIERIVDNFRDLGWLEPIIAG